MSQFTPAVADEVNPRIAAPALEELTQDTMLDAAVQPEIDETCEAKGYATAGWVWGETGGISILQQRGDRWVVIGGTVGVYSPQ